MTLSQACQVRQLIFIGFLFDEYLGYLLSKIIRNE